MHLLLGVGDIEDDLRTLDETVERARTAGDTLTVAVYSDETESVEDTVTAVRERLTDLDFDATVLTVEGDAGGRLVDLADREDVDRIVLSGGQRSPLGKIRLSRVAEFVLLNATQSVTLIR